MKVLYYEVGKPPVELCVSDGFEGVKLIVGGKYKVLMLANGCAIVCNHKQPVGKPRGKVVNRVVKLPDLTGGKSVSVKHGSICGDFVVCGVSDGELCDLPSVAVDEVKALCGR